MKITKKNVAYYQQIIDNDRKQNSPSFTVFKYENLQPTTLSIISTSCLDNQQFVCGYCGTSLQTKHEVTNEHMVPQSELRNNPKNYKFDEFDYSNIIASCKNKNQCDDSHGNKILPVLPTDSNWDHCKFDLNGYVHTSDNDLAKSFEILNIGNKNNILIKNRSQKINELLDEIDKGVKCAISLFDEKNPRPKAGSSKITLYRYNAQKKDFIQKSTVITIKNFLWEIPHEKYRDYGSIMKHFLTTHQSYKSIMQTI